MKVRLKESLPKENVDQNWKLYTTKCLLENKINPKKELSLRKLKDNVYPKIGKNSVKNIILC